MNKELDENKIDSFLDEILIKYKNEVKELAKNKKYANIILSIDMFSGKIGSKYNIKSNLEINRSELV